ncbi:MAG: hypothetical protein IPM94_13865 [bacterium]|nr:hypothetical protein [bacterium]
MHETLLAVPLVIAGGIGPIGAVRAEPALLTDLFATVLQAGRPARRDSAAGQPLLFAAAAAADRLLVREYEGETPAW